MEDLRLCTGENSLLSFCSYLIFAFMTSGTFFQVRHEQRFHVKAIAAILRCGGAKTDLISSFKSVNVYVTFVC